MNNLNLVTVLRDASMNCDPLVRKPAAATLEGLRRTPYFIASTMVSNSLSFNNSPQTQQVIQDHSIDEQTRTVAIVFLRESLRRVLGRNADFPVDMSTRELLHRELLKLHAIERNGMVSSQLALLIAKIARHDWPEHWGSLFPAIGEMCQTPKCQYRGVELLNEVLEELSSLRLEKDRVALETEAYQLISLVTAHWVRHSEDLANLVQSPYEEISPIFHITMMSTKCVGHLVALISKLDESPELQALFPLVAEVLTMSYELLRRCSTPSHADLFVQYIDEVMNTVIIALKNHPVEFRAYLLPFLSIFIKQVLTYPQIESLLFDSYIVEVLEFLALALKLTDNKHRIQLTPLYGIQINEEVAASFLAIEREIYSPQAIPNIVKILITHYFPLHQNDYQLWENDAEAFHLETVSNLSHHTKRYASINFMEKLISKYPETVCSVIFEAVHSAFANGLLSPDVPPQELQVGLAFQDAALCSLGLASFELHRLKSHLDLIGFLRTHLLVEATQGSSNLNTHGLFKVIRRRIAILIGQWFYVDNSITSEDARQLLYPVLIELLKDLDPAVSFAAMWALGQLIDAPSFIATTILPYLQQILEHIFAIFGEANQLEIRSDVLRTLTLLVEKLGTDILRVAPFIVDRIPRCWNDCDDQNILRNSIVNVVLHLVKALRYNCHFLTPFIITILQFATETENSESLFLLESGLELWQAFLENLNALPRELEVYFEQWCNLTQSNGISEVISLMKILESYCLLGGANFLRYRHDIIVNTMIQLLESVNDDGVVAICGVADTMTCLLNKDTTVLLGNLQTYFFKKITQEPRQVSDRVLSHMLSVTCRLFIQEFDKALAILNNLNVSRSDSNLLYLYFSLLLRKFDSIDKPYQRKVCALVLCSFLATREEAVLKELGWIVNICTSVLFEFQDDSLHISLQEKNTAHWTEDQRRIVLVLNDPINSIRIKDFVAGKLTFLETSFGKIQFQHMLNGLVDPSVLKQLKQLLNSF